MRPNSKNLKNSKNFFFLILILILIIAAFAAGVWQTQRAQQHQTAADAALNAVANDSQRAVLRGRWVKNADDTTIIVAPRIINAVAGVWVVSLWQNAGNDQENGSIVPVLRGWLPYIAAGTPPKIPLLFDAKPTDLSQPLILRGTWVKDLPKVYALSNTQPTQLGTTTPWINYDAALHLALYDKTALTKKTKDKSKNNTENTAENNEASPTIFVQLAATNPADETSAAAPWRRENPAPPAATWQTRADKSRGYAVQWFGLAGVGLIGLCVMLFRRKQRRQGNQGEAV